VPDSRLHKRIGDYTQTDPSGILSVMGILHQFAVRSEVVDGSEIRLQDERYRESMTVAASAQLLLSSPALSDDVRVPFQNAGTSAQPQV
jgi:hypothetical protein